MEGDSRGDVREYWGLRPQYSDISPPGIPFLVQQPIKVFKLFQARLSYGLRSIGYAPQDVGLFPNTKQQLPLVKKRLVIYGIIRLLKGLEVLHEGLIRLLKDFIRP